MVQTRKPLAPGFNPYGVARPVQPTRSFGVLLWGLIGCLALSALILLGAATPVQSAGAITPRKTVAPPAGAIGLCDQYAWACATHIKDQKDLSPSALIALGRRVNLAVNASVREVLDIDQYGREEHWALPTRHGGDCEDFSLLKKRELLELGVAPDRLLIATALTETREAHAVLILRTGAGDYVLDNRRNAMLPWQDTGYSFLRMQDPEAPSRWRMILAGGMF